MGHMKVQMWDRRRLGFYEAMPRHYCDKMSLCCDSCQGDTLLLNGGNARVPTRGHWRTGGGDWRWYPDIKGLIFTSLGFVDLYVAIIHLFIYLWWWYS